MYWLIITINKYTYIPEAADKPVKDKPTQHIDDVSIRCEVAHIMLLSMKIPEIQVDTEVLLLWQHIIYVCHVTYPYDVTWLLCVNRILWGDRTSAFELIMDFLISTFSCCWQMYSTELCRRKYDDVHSW